MLIEDCAESGRFELPKQFNPFTAFRVRPIRPLWQLSLKRCKCNGHLQTCKQYFCDYKNLLKTDSIFLTFIGFATKSLQPESNAFTTSAYTA